MDKKDWGIHNAIMHVRLPKQHKDKVEASARREGISVSLWMRKIIEKSIDTND